MPTKPYKREAPKPPPPSLFEPLVFEVVEAIIHEGKTRSPGETIEMNLRQAKHYLLKSQIKPFNPKKKKGEEAK
jgi:hypothetical protein